MANPAYMMMAPRRLPIVVPLDLVPRRMLVNIPNFSGMAYEDPSNQIERYIETLVTNVISDESYWLVWVFNHVRGRGV